MAALTELKEREEAKERISRMILGILGK